MTTKNPTGSPVNGELGDPATDWGQVMAAFRKEGTLAGGDIPASMGDEFITVSYVGGRGIGDEMRSRLRKMAWAAMMRRLPISDLHFAEGGLWVNFTDRAVPHDLFLVWDLWKEVGGWGCLAAVFMCGKRMMGPTSLCRHSQEVTEKR